MQKTAPSSTPVQSLAATALPVGGMLGWLAWELSRMPERAEFNLAMAFLLVGSGCASFVLHRLHVRSQRPQATRHVLAREARTSLCWLGSGILIALHLLPTLAA